MTSQILKALQRLLRVEDMNVLCASRASEALELLEKHPTQVVVTDQRMPEMSGVDFLAQVRERQPDIVRMMLTGYTEMKVAVDAINRGEIYRLITKPWNDDELRATLRQASSRDLMAESSGSTRHPRADFKSRHEPNLKGKSRRTALAENTTAAHTLRADDPDALEAVDAKDAYTRGTPRGGGTRRRRARDELPKT